MNSAAALPPHLHVYKFVSQMYSDLTVRLDVDFKKRGLFVETVADSVVQDFRHLILMSCQTSFDLNLLQDFQVADDVEGIDITEMFS